MTSIGVVIPNWNGTRVLEACLRALGDQQRRPDKVLVVDNGSTDGSDLIAERMPDVSVLRLGRNTGFGFAANRGVEQCDTEWVAVLNSDACPEPDWLGELSEHLTGLSPAVWAVGSIQLRPDGSIESAGDAWSPTGAAYKLLNGATLDALPDHPYEVLSPPGAAPLFRRSAFESLGGYDEGYFLYYEDLELSWRARWRGWRAVQVPSARVRHEMGGSGNAARAQRYSARNSLITTVRHLPRLRPLTLLRHTAHEARVAHQRQVLAPYLAGRAEGLVALPAALARRRRERAQRVTTPEAMYDFLQRQEELAPARL